MGRKMRRSKDQICFRSNKASIPYEGLKNKVPKTEFGNGTRILAVERSKGNCISFSYIDLEVNHSKGNHKYNSRIQDFAEEGVVEVYKTGIIKECPLGLTQVPLHEGVCGAGSLRWVHNRLGP
ncbi:hypothetical protein QYF36_011362 [Acer negundo]|nr:hypothetical protein QYF36_005491 [Acer negundo]KAK4850964.1 hypothetical protein QYF36_011362 [Acer negundo]